MSETRSRARTALLAAISMIGVPMAVLVILEGVSRWVVFGLAVVIGVCTT